MNSSSAMLMQVQIDLVGFSFSLACRRTPPPASYVLQKVEIIIIKKKSTLIAGHLADNRKQSLVELNRIFAAQAAHSSMELMLD